MLILLAQQQFVDFGLEAGFVAGSDGHGWFAVEGDVEDGRDGADAEGCCHVAAFVDVDFVDYDLAVIFFCQFFQDRGDASAGAAPCGGEVYDCRLGAEVVHFFAVKVVYQF